MLINYRNEMLHDSSLYAFRDPVGAVEAGAPVTMRFRTRLNNVASVYLCVYSEQYREDRGMTLSDGYWQVSFSAPHEPDTYWYHFAVNVDGKLVYYGADGKRTAGIGCAYTELPPAFQLTVYAPGFMPAKWFPGAVMYQIFPDRFRRSQDGTAQRGLDYHRSKGRAVYEHKSWNEKPLFRPLTGQKAYDPCDYFGGTLRGIEESLDYIAGLGVDVIYLNPIFEAASNHRYNAADYLRVDPVLGTEDDLKSLCEKAAEKGIRIMLDGVYSHTGSDSIYFNKNLAYDSLGAANSPESPYYQWYSFEHYPDKYKCWWGFESLPEVNEHNPHWQDFVVTGENSVIRHWLKAGIMGYRLDVADELPDDVLELIYSAARQTQPDTVILGEVWEDATTKYSYGAKRRYALGGRLDSVTNYPFRNAAISFLTGKSDAEDLRDFLVDQAVKYPLPMYHSLTNLLSSHDVTRIRTALSTPIDPHSLSREQQASFVISDSQNRKGAFRQRLAAALQFSIPGVPCIYYGDENGMNGFLDPFNREPFREGSYELTEDYRRFAQLRRSADTLRTGHAVFYAPDPDCIAVLRYVADGRDALGREAEDGAYLIVINRSDMPQQFVLDFMARSPLFPPSHQAALRPLLNGRATCQITGKEYAVRDALLELTVRGMGVMWLKFDSFEQSEETE